ncbi:MAG TPA: SDR family NAD(P)-dependent oxidoreductase [Patescibacteria group bacterium]|nr:SDR family NAD(P)-dependent oxidoreductase [Patescibacteria group bacterium]
MNGRRILVTGGTGFVGSHLVEELVKRGARVVVPYRSLDPQSYFVTRGLEKKVILANGDVTDRRRIADIVTKYEIEDIFHLAAQPIVDTAYYNPVETITTNVLGTTHILDAALNSGTVRRIIITSSDKAYGKSSETYTEDSPLLGDHPYEASKAAGDMVTKAYVKTYGAPVVTVRFGNIYGGGDLNMSRIIPGIMNAALTHETLHLRSDGTFMRDYVYVGDVVSAYVFLEDHVDEIKGEVFNVASDTNISVLDLIKRAQKILRISVPHQIDNNQKNEIPYQHLNWSKIAGLGWKPAYSLEKGLKETYKWYKKSSMFLSFRPNRESIKHKE